MAIMAILAIPAKSHRLIQPAKPLAWLAPAFCLLAPFFSMDKASTRRHRPQMSPETSLNPPRPDFRPCSVGLRLDCLLLHFNFGNYGSSGNHGNPVSAL